jgi:glycosyltransferase involved in cell wall biosynthesis
VHVRHSIGPQLRAPPLLAWRSLVITARCLRIRRGRPGKRRPLRAQPVLLDITRLIGRAHRSGPGGIDRIELAYAQHFLLSAEAGRPAYAVIHLMGRLYGVNPRCARRFVQKVAARWQGEGAAMRRRRPRGILGLYATLLGGHWMAGWQLRRRLKDHPGPPIYLVVSHRHLARAHWIDNIRRAFAARAVCFLHDLIPIDYPEFVAPGLAQMHGQMLLSIVRNFDAVIVNSQTTAEHFRHYLARSENAGMNIPKIQVALPGVRAFPSATAAATSRPPGSVPYFVIIGTIEPKKNHLLLLNLWSELATSMSPPPRLLVIGARGWENEQAVDMLERSHRLHGLVEEHNHLSDSAIGALLKDARAVLLPSIVEGFGLPLAEALASGVPVICSDIPAFREVGRDTPEYLDPLDIQAWREAVVDYCHADSARREAQLHRLPHWPMPPWQAHFRIVEKLLHEISEPRPLCS